MIQFADRIKALQEYYFSRKLREVHELISKGKPIINIGIGNPDLQPPTAVTKAIQESITEPGSHKYQSYQGIPELREAIAHFYVSHYKVSLDSSKEILPLMGSKEGIMHISLALLNEGDKVLIPNPGYPTYTSVTRLTGAQPVYYNLSEENQYQPHFEQLEKQDLRGVKLMWVNYPHMPTGENAKQKTYKNIISFAKKHQVLVVNDNPYSFILNEKPASILEIDGAKDIAIELNSLSKTFNMAGWRVGMLLGNSDFLNKILKVKTQMDSGMFYGIQKGAIEALQTSKQWLQNQNQLYHKRKTLIFELAELLNCSFQKNTSGLFVWTKLPKGRKSEEFIDELLYKYHIFVAPGIMFGTQGEGYIRFSLCADEQQIKEAIRRFR